MLRTIFNYLIFRVSVNVYETRPRVKLVDCMPILLNAARVFFVYNATSDRDLHMAQSSGETCRLYIECDENVYHCMHKATRVIVTYTYLLQDYEAFFKAIECEHLFDYLDVEVPSHEVEYTLRHG